MLISDAIRNVDWDACQKFQSAAGDAVFGIVCKDKDDLLTVLAASIEFYYDQEVCGHCEFVKLLLSGEETHTEGGCSTKVWPTVAWDDPWNGEGRTVQWESTGQGAMAWGGCDDMAVAQYAEDMNLMEQWREEGQ